MPATLPKDFVAASAPPMILALLEKADSYGYELIQQAETLSEGQFRWAEGMLYPLLHRLENKSWIEAYWGKAPTGRKRKYYRITQEGKSVLAEQRKQWQQVNHLLQQ